MSISNPIISPIWFVYIPCWRPVHPRRCFQIVPNSWLIAVAIYIYIWFMGLKGATDSWLKKTHLERTGRHLHGIFCDKFSSPRHVSRSRRSCKCCSRNGTWNASAASPPPPVTGRCRLLWRGKGGALLDHYS